MRSRVEVIRLLRASRPVGLVVVVVEEDIVIISCIRSINLNEGCLGLCSQFCAFVVAVVVVVVVVVNVPSLTVDDAIREIAGQLWDFFFHARWGRRNLGRSGWGTFGAAWQRPSGGGFTARRLKVSAARLTFAAQLNLHVTKGTMYT